MLLTNLENATLFPVANKKPLVSWGDLEAGEQVQGPPGCQYAMATGARSGVVVIDIDDLEAKLPGAIPTTYMRRTPRGGLHLFFEVPEGVHIPTLQSFPVKGMDLRGDGGYVVFFGDGYEDINDHDIAPLPDWVLQKLLERPAKKERLTKLHTVDLSTEKGQKFYRAAEHDAKTMDVGEAGTRDTALWLAALNLVCRRGMPVEEAANLLEEHYAPRVSEDGQHTVSRERILYKCQSAAETGTIEFSPWTQEDFDHWVAVCKPLIEKRNIEERRERYGLMDLTKAIEARTTPSKLKSRDMVPSPKLAKVSFADLCNILATHESWASTLRFNTFSQEFVAVDPILHMDQAGFFSNEDVSAMRMWLASHLGLTAGASEVAAAMNRVARDNEFHPVREYLATLDEVKDPRKVLEDFARTGMGISEEISVTCVRKFMMAAVRRVLEPGVKVDSVLLLQGPQGCGKSALLYALSPDRQWVQESVPDLEHKDAQECLRGRWLVELAELQSVFRKSEAAVKDFLSRQEDSYRRPYDRGTTRTPRQCVFIGTTNDIEILRDPTGARRYWIAQTEGIDIGWIESHRDEIWSAALALALTDEIHYLTMEEGAALAEIQEPLEVFYDPWEPAIEKYLSDKTYVISASDVYLGVFHASLATMGTLGEAARSEVLRNCDRPLLLRIGSIMRRLGWQKRKGRKGLRWERYGTTANDTNETTTSPPTGAPKKEPLSSPIQAALSSTLDAETEPSDVQSNEGAGYSRADLAHTSLGGMSKTGGLRRIPSDSNGRTSDSISETLRNAVTSRLKSSPIPPTP